MSLEDFCYKCREERDRIRGGWTILPGDHCHHQPREEPTQCWCKKNAKLRVYDGLDYITPLFCFQCGRKL
jgi:hypothetical protein